MISKRILLWRSQQGKFWGWDGGGIEGQKGEAGGVGWKPRVSKPGVSESPRNFQELNVRLFLGALLPHWNKVDCSLRLAISTKLNKYLLTLSSLTPSGYAACFKQIPNDVFFLGGGQTTTRRIPRKKKFLSWNKGHKNLSEWWLRISSIPVASKMIRTDMFSRTTPITDTEVHCQKNWSQLQRQICGNDSMLAEKFSLEIQILLWIPSTFHYRHRLRARNKAIL